MGVREGVIAFLVASLLKAWSDSNKAGHVVCEVLFQLDPNGKLKRKPDVAFVAVAKWPLDRPLPDQDAWPIAPTLAVEVVSPTNTMNEIAGKIEDYFTHGVERVWVVLPKQRKVCLYDSANHMQAVLIGDRIRDDLFPGLDIEVAQIFPLTLQ